MRGLSMTPSLTAALIATCCPGKSARSSASNRAGSGPGGRVITTRYTNWRTHERIDGFGLTTDGAARMNSLGVDTRGP